MIYIQVFFYRFFFSNAPSIEVLCFARCFLREKIRFQSDIFKTLLTALIMNNMWSHCFYEWKYLGYEFFHTLQEIDTCWDMSHNMRFPINKCGICNQQILRPACAFSLWPELRNSIRECFKQFGSRSGPTFCWSWFGSKLFAKFISRQQKSPLWRKLICCGFLNGPTQTLDLPGGF